MQHGESEMPDRDDARTETDVSGLSQPESERITVESQPPRADAAEVQADGPQHEFAMDSVGGEPIEPTREDIRSPERDSGELGERPGGAHGVRRGIRNRDAEPDRDDFVARADPPEDSPL